MIPRFTIKKDLFSLSTVAIITAGGKGSRLGGKTVQQFISVERKPILSHVISRFEACELIDAIYIAVPEDLIEICIEKCIKPFQFLKVKKIIAGGKERSDSVYNCLKVVDDNCKIVIIHDGVRLFVTDSMIEESINAATEHGASICAIPLHDTIKSVSEDLFIKEHRNRDGIYCVQTPQAFKKDLIFDAYEQAGIARSKFTDDSLFIEKYSKCKIKVVLGSIFNIKITKEEDLQMASLFLRAGI
jgi:2-C-methyl-D-erythritol 4-phosphate cytidylyltransferase